VREGAGKSNGQPSWMPTRQRHRCSHCIVIGRSMTERALEASKLRGQRCLRGDGNRRGSDGERADGGGDLVVNTVDDHDRTDAPVLATKTACVADEGHGLRVRVVARVASTAPVWNSARRPGYRCIGDVEMPRIASATIGPGVPPTCQSSGAVPLMALTVPSPEFAT